MTAHPEEKPSAKTLLRGVIESRPEDASYEESMRELAFERMVGHGLSDVRAGRSMCHFDALRRIHEWSSQ